MKMENDLGQDSIWKLVLRLALPAMAAQFINVLYSIVDRIYLEIFPERGVLPWPERESAVPSSPYFLPLEPWSA